MTVQFHAIPNNEIWNILIYVDACEVSGRKKMSLLAFLVKLARSCEAFLGCHFLHFLPMCVEGWTDKVLAKVI